MSGRLTVHDPRGYPPKVTGKRLAPRFASLDGKIVYLVDCLFDNSAAFMEQLRQWFAAHLPAVATRIITPRESWVESLKSARDPLGAVERRTILSTSFTRSFPGAPEGDYAIVLFRTSFAKKEDAAETVTLEHEADGAWRVVGYLIR